MTLSAEDERYIYCGNTRTIPPPLVPGVPEVGFLSLKKDNLGSDVVTYVQVRHFRLTRDFEYRIKKEEVCAIFVPERFPTVDLRSGSWHFGKKAVEYLDANSANDKLRGIVYVKKHVEVFWLIRGSDSATNLGEVMRPVDYGAEDTWQMAPTDCCPRPPCDE